MFLINMRISSIYLFFLAHLVRINVEPPISNSKIRWIEIASTRKQTYSEQMSSYAFASDELQVDDLVPTPAW
jgi:hypothetical protein